MIEKQNQDTRSPSARARHAEVSRRAAYIAARLQGATKNEARAKASHSVRWEDK
jgi:hypothetical protein